MKTVRQQVFETNSSSTHSVTICVNTSATPSFKPFTPDGKAEIKRFGPTEDEDWKGKLGMLAYCLKVMSREAEIADVVKSVEDFSGLEITLNEEALGKVRSFSTPEEIEEEFGDSFYGFIHEYYGHPDAADLTSTIETLLSDKAIMLAFVCSTGWFDIQGYYDG